MNLGLFGDTYSVGIFYHNELGPDELAEYWHDSRKDKNQYIITYRIRADKYEHDDLGNFVFVKRGKAVASVEHSIVGFIASPVHRLG